MANPEVTLPTSDSTAELISRTYPVLRRMAAARAQGRDMSPSSLAQETVCRLLKQPSPPTNEEHLHAAAWKIMEWILLDRLRSEHARDQREQRHAVPRPGGHSGDGRLPALVEAMNTLAQHSPRKAEALTLWALCGLPIERIATLLEVSGKTVQRDLDFAKAWLAVHAGQRIEHRP